MNERDSFEPLRTRGGTPPPPQPIKPFQPFQDFQGVATQLGAWGSTPPPAKPRRTFGLPLLLGSSLTTLALGVGIGWAAFHTTSPSTISVHGSITVGATQYAAGSAACDAPSGFTDISPGVAVTIGDQTGKTIGVGQLGNGIPQASGCKFPFQVTVPGGSSLYTVTISHRGTQTYTAAQTATGFDMALGG